MRFIVWNVPARFNTLGKAQPDWWEDSLVKYALDAAASEQMEQGSNGAKSMRRV